MKETDIALDIDLRENNDLNLLKTKIDGIDKEKRLLVYVRDISILDKIRELEKIKIMSVLKKNETDWVICACSSSG